MTEHSPRATVALQRLVEFDPAFGSLSLWCRHRDATPETALVLRPDDRGGVDVSEAEYEIAPAYTDGRTIYYGRQFETWEPEQQMAVCAHEILHIALQHVARGQRIATRLGARHSHRLFNVAADALVNESLKEAGYSLPKPHVELGEVLRSVLRSPLFPHSALAELDVETLYVQILDVAEAGGEQAAALEAMLDFSEKDIAPDGATGPGQALEATEWDQRLKRAFAAGSRAGHGLGKLMGRFGDIPRSRMPWELILRRLVTKAVTLRPEPTFEIPTRRWLAREAEACRTGTPAPVYEPGIRKAASRSARIAVCVDVSGSITGSVLTRFGGEIDGISRRTGAEIHLIVFDNGIQLCHKLAQAELGAELKGLEFNAGGGTSFVEPIEEATKTDPSIIVVLTDLEGPHGAAPGRIPVVWACPNHQPPQPPFGRIVILQG